MNEGPWTVAAQLCSPEASMLAACNELAKALHRIGAAVRMSQNECVHADVRRASLEQTVLAWRNVNDVLEDATTSAERALSTLLGEILRAPAPSQMREADD